MRRLIVYCLGLVLATGNVLPAQALYQCYRTGKRTLMRCCCEPAPAAGARARGAISPQAIASTCSHCQPVNASNGSSPLKAYLTRPCCKVSYEKGTPAGVAAALGLDSSFKKTLSDARLLLAGLLPFQPRLDSFAAACTFTRTELQVERSAPPPLFLIHCALLL